MNWYETTMPTVKDTTPYITELATIIKKMNGVQNVFVFGSFAEHMKEENYPIRDVDLLVQTKFNSGDLMAIDSGPDSPLKMIPAEWENYGFNPEVVKFTKAYTMKGWNLDHWVASEDNKLLHWGAMPESIEEWIELHSQAEKHAQKITGYNLLKLNKQTDTIKRDWHEAFSYSMKKQMGKQPKYLGWCPSDNPASDLLTKAIQI